jgi:integrase
MSEKTKILDEFRTYRTQVMNKSEQTAKTEYYNLKKFADWLGVTDFKKVDKRLMQEYFKTVRNLRVKNLIAIHMKTFYRWLLDLDKKKTPDNIKWFEYSSQRSIKKKHGFKNREQHFITKDEYLKLLEQSFDNTGQERGLWEIFYLSGCRRGEILGLKRSDIAIDDNENVTISVNGKTGPREVPIPEHPKHFLRWYHNHPNKEKDASMWISYS